MFLIDNIDLIYEASSLPSENEQQQVEPTQIIEFENIKKILIYDKIKTIQNKLKKIINVTNDPELKSYLLDVIDFIDLIITYYNTINYIQVTTLLNSFVHNLSQLFKIELPDLTNEMNPNLTLPSPDGTQPPPKLDGLQPQQQVNPIDTQQQVNPIDTQPQQQNMEK